MGNEVERARRRTIKNLSEGVRRKNNGERERTKKKTSEEK
jgi:hypothetical protein